MPTYSFSKEITRQLGAATKVATSAVGVAAAIKEAIDRKVEPVLDAGGARVDWNEVQSIFGRLLVHSAANLRTVDERHAQSDVDSGFLRRQRNEAAKKLRQELRRARFLLDDTLSKEAANSFFPQRGIVSSIDPANLVRLGRHIAGLLRGETGQLRSQLAGGELINAAALIEALESATAGLEAALAELEPKLRQKALSFDQRRQERQEAVRTFRATREMLDGFYRLAGYDYLADQLRDTRRKKPEAEEAPIPPKAAEAASV